MYEFRYLCIVLIKSEKYVDVYKTENGNQKRRGGWHIFFVEEYGEIKYRKWRPRFVSGIITKGELREEDD